MKLFQKNAAKLSTSIMENPSASLLAALTVLVVSVGYSLLSAFGHLV